MKVLVALTSAAMLTLTCGGAANAQSGPYSEKVTYADLDLSRASGRQTLEHRVEATVTHVCPNRPPAKELLMWQAYQACRDTAWAGARQQLAAIYNGRQLAQQGARIPGRGE